MTPEQLASLRAGEPEAGSLASLNALLDGADPRDVLEWAFETVRPVAIAVSFQVGGLVLAHMSRDLVERVPALFIQTGFHFPETLAFRDRMVAEWNLELIETTPTLGPERQAVEYGPNLYQTDPDTCCQLNKVLPLQATLETLAGWITGVRRDEASTRQATPVVERQVLSSGRSIWKVNPLASWTKADIDAYAQRHAIPRHPLYDQGYRSIGCAPCTRPVAEGEDDRAGRWAGQDKVECGIHTFGKAGDDGSETPADRTFRAITA